MSVSNALQKDIEALGARAVGSTLAETALALARELDKPKNSATSKSMCAKAMIDVLRELRSVAPANRGADGVDDLRARRKSRRSAAAADSARP
jgi:hypothetical protein